MIKLILEITRKKVRETWGKNTGNFLLGRSKSLIITTFNLKSKFKRLNGSDKRYFSPLF